MSSDSRGYRLKGSLSSNIDLLPLNFHSCTWTWLVYCILDFGRKCSRTHDNAPKNVGSLERISMGSRSPSPLPSSSLGPHAHLLQEHEPILRGRNEERVEVRDGRLPSYLEDMVERTGEKKGSTPHHTPEKVASPWTPKHKYHMQEFSK